MVLISLNCAAGHDLDFDLTSYVWALGSCCMNALYLTLVKRECNRRLHDNVVSEISLVNNLVPIPLLLTYLELTRQRQQALAFEAWRDPVFCAAVMASTAAGCLLGYAQCLCTQHSSALTTTIVGQVWVCGRACVGVRACVRACVCGVGVGVGVCTRVRACVRACVRVLSSRMHSCVLDCARACRVTRRLVRASSFTLPTANTEASTPRPR